MRKMRKLTDPKMLAKYAAHVTACRRVGIAPETQKQFLADVLQVPEDMRAAVLSVDKLEPYEPQRTYDLYIQPKDAEHMVSSELRMRRHKQLKEQRAATAGRDRQPKES